VPVAGELLSVHAHLHRGAAGGQLRRLAQGRAARAVERAQRGGGGAEADGQRHVAGRRRLHLDGQLRAGRASAWGQRGDVHGLVVGELGGGGDGEVGHAPVADEHGEGHGAHRVAGRREAQQRGRRHTVRQVRRGAVRVQQRVQPGRLEDGWHHHVAEAAAVQVVAQESRLRMHGQAPHGDQRATRGGPRGWVEGDHVLRVCAVSDVVVPGVHEREPNARVVELLPVERQLRHHGHWRRAGHHRQRHIARLQRELQLAPHQVRVERRHGAPNVLGLAVLVAHHVPVARLEPLRQLHAVAPVQAFDVAIHIAHGGHGGRARWGQSPLPEADEVERRLVAVVDGRLSDPRHARASPKIGMAQPEPDARCLLAGPIRTQREHRLPPHQRRSAATRLAARVRSRLWVGRRQRGVARHAPTRPRARLVRLHPVLVASRVGAERLEGAAADGHLSVLLHPQVAHARSSAAGVQRLAAQRKVQLRARHVVLDLQSRQHVGHAVHGPHAQLVAWRQLCAVQLGRQRQVRVHQHRLGARGVVDADQVVHGRMVGERTAASPRQVGVRTRHARLELHTRRRVAAVCELRLAPSRRPLWVQRRHGRSPFPGAHVAAAVVAVGTHAPVRRRRDRDVVVAHREVVPMRQVLGQHHAHLRVLVPHQVHRLEEGLSSPGESPAAIQLRRGCVLDAGAGSGRQLRAQVPLALLVREAGAAGHGEGPRVLVHTQHVQITGQLGRALVGVPPNHHLVVHALGAEGHLWDGLQLAHGEGGAPPHARAQSGAGGGAAVPVAATLGPVEVLVPHHVAPAALHGLWQPNPATGVLVSGQEAVHPHRRPSLRLRHRLR